MKRAFMPKTTLSKISFWLCLISIILFILYIIVSPGIDPKVDSGFYSFQTLAILAVIFFVACIPSFLAGLYSIIFHKARSVMVFLTLGINIILLLIMVPEYFL